MSVVTIGACSGGWRFTIPGQTVVDVIGIDDRVLDSVAVETVRVGRRVMHLGLAHRVLEVRDGGMVRRLVHQSRECAL